MFCYSSAVYKSLVHVFLITVLLCNRLVSAKRHGSPEVHGLFDVLVIILPCHILFQVRSGHGTCLEVRGLFDVFKSVGYAPAKAKFQRVL